MADKSVLLWVVGVAACALGAFLLLLGLAGVRWPLTGWRITSRSRVVAVSSIGAVALLGGTFILSRLAFYVIAGVVVGPFLLIALLTTASLGGFLMQFTEPLAPSRRKVGRRRRREIAEDSATYLESLRRRYAEGSWSEMDWEGLWSQCSDRVAPRSRKQRGRACSSRIGMRFQASWSSFSRNAPLAGMKAFQRAPCIVHTGRGSGKGKPFRLRDPTSTRWSCSGLVRSG